MARRLLCFSAMRLLAGVGLLAMGAGCPIPIPAEVEDQDAGTNSTPAILHPVPDMPFGSTAGPLLDDDFPVVSFDVRDVDVDDTIFVRVFRNFQLTPDIARQQQTVPGGEVVRPVELSTSTWCLGAEGTNNVVFEILVSDRAFLSDDIEPHFRATTGETASRSWVMNCSP
jgi:hypothetical protein